MSEAEGLVPMQCKKFNTDLTVNGVCYKQFESPDEQVDRHNVEK